MYKSSPTPQEIQQPTDMMNSESDLPLLFDYEDELQTSNAGQQSPDSSRHPVSDVTMPSSNSHDTSVNTPQIPIKQRKATKILIFFDDDTYQEIIQNP